MTSQEQPAPDTSEGMLLDAALPQGVEDEQNP